MKKLPPFGKILHNMQVQGYAPLESVYLYVGRNAFPRATKRQVSQPGALCLPPYLPAGEFRWPVKQCDLLIIDDDYCVDEYLDDLAYHLYKSGAKVVRAILTDLTIVVIKP